MVVYSVRWYKVYGGHTVRLHRWFHRWTPEMSSSVLIHVSKNQVDAYIFHIGKFKDLI